MGTIIKGQNFRLFVNLNPEGSSVFSCIGASTSCTLHVSASVEDVSTKDSTTLWVNQAVSSKSWDCSVDALVVNDSSDTSALHIDDIIGLIGEEVEIKFDFTKGSKNRESLNWNTFEGKAIVTDVSINAQNKANVTYSMQLSGNGLLAL